MTDAYVASHDAIARQLEMEKDMFRVSAEALMKDLEEAKDSEKENDTVFASRLMLGKIAAVTEGVKEFFAEAASGKPGIKPIACKYLGMLEPEVAAALALRGVLAGISKPRTIQRCAVLVGRMVEDELLWRTFEAQAPDEAGVTAKKLKKVSSYTHRKRVVRTMTGRAEINHIDMSEADRVHVGTALIGIVVSSTDLIETHEAGDGTAASKRMIYVSPRPEALKWIEGFTKWYAQVSPEWWPTVAPPKPWTGPHNGGYYTTIPRPLPLVKGARKAFLEELNHVEMPEVYRAINAVQDSAFKVDRWVLETMETVWGLGGNFGGLPSRESAELPAKPEDIDTNEEARNEWKKGAAKIYAANVKTLSRRLQFDQGLKMARRFVDEPAIYFPHQFDFRGRMYAIPLLSYQGPDWMRGLLRFAEGKPIENIDAALYLMIQGANLWGFDKGTIESREQWVEERQAQIEQAGTDPLADYWWADADSPWQFLQWCREWTEFTKRGYGYVSSFICSADGTCNGLQHFSAMLRDPVGGGATNLVPGDKPSDIYAKVAEVVLAKLRLIAAGSGIVPKEVDGRSARQWAELWLEFGVTRKDTKRSVMVLPYGGTQYSTREFIEDAIRDRLSDGGVNPFPCRVKNKEGQMTETDGVFNASMFLAPFVWEAIGEVVVAARDAMAWLKKVASTVAKDGIPVNWMTPDGFPVQQAYHKTKAKVVDLKMAGQRLQLIIREELPEIDKRRQEQGVSPNFVHSCDGTALRQYVCYAVENGIKSFALVHDSFGSVAADYVMMGSCLRTAFVDMYEGADVMQALRDHLANHGDLPEVPARGSLDIRGVLDSRFFFA